MEFYLRAVYEEYFRRGVEDYFIVGAKETWRYLVKGFEEGRRQFHRVGVRVFAVIMLVWVVIMIERNGLRDRVVGNMRATPAVAAPWNHTYSSPLNVAELPVPGVFTPPSPGLRGEKLKFLMPGVQDNSGSWKDLVRKPFQDEPAARPFFFPPPSPSPPPSPPPDVPSPPAPPGPPPPLAAALKAKWQQMKETEEERKEKLKEEFVAKIAELTPDDHLGPQLRRIQNLTDEAVRDEKEKREAALEWRAKMESSRIDAMRKRHSLDDQRDDRRRAFPKFNDGDIANLQRESAQVNAEAANASIMADESFKAWREALETKKTYEEKLTELKRQRGVLCAEHSVEALKKGVMCD